MPVVTVERGLVPVPAEILSRIGIRDGDRVVVESVGDSIQLRPASQEDADAELLRVLDDPVNLGVKGPLTRASIYDETD